MENININKRGDIFLGTKENIMYSAVKLFAEHGFHKTTMDRIAIDSNVAKGTLYWHFPSKKDLFIGIVISELQDYFSFLNKIKENQKLSSHEKLEKIIDKKMLFLKKHKIMLREVLTERDDIDKEIRDKMKELKKEHIQILTDIFSQGIEENEFAIKDPYIAALAFIGMNISLASDPVLFEEENRLNTTKILKDIIFKGILR